VKGHRNDSASIPIDLAVDLRRDCEEKVKVRESNTIVISE